MSEPPDRPCDGEAPSSRTRDPFSGLAAAPPGLDGLLLALRAERIPVGIGELSWLCHAFALAPRLDREGLRDLLACTLVKDPARRARL